MSDQNKVIVGRWFTEFWGKDFNPGVIDELAAPDIRFEYSMHAPCRGRDGFLAVSSGFGDHVSVVPAWRVDEGVVVSLGA